jgi:glycogen debranching enzyme
VDGEKKKVLSVASNVGQCLWSGIIAPEPAGTVVKRLMRKDMWSALGIRTLSADHPSFNPYNYQTGAAWPHDNSLIAMGMRRYGFAAEAAAVARDISRAASHFLLNQLPELYGGLQRDPTSFPVQYIGANVPQAWAAGTPFMLLQAMLGLQQDAPAPSFTSIQRCRTGCRTWRLPICGWDRGVSTSASGGTETRHGGRCSRENTMRSPDAAMPVEIICRRTKSFQLRILMKS